jgi:hypothetical protein
VLRSALKLGDGGQETGYGAGKASGSIISRVVRSYWNDQNMYRGELLGVVIPGNDRNVSKKIADRVGWDLRIRGDVWDVELLKYLTVNDLLALLDVRG